MAGLANREDERLCTAARAGSQRLRLENARRNLRVSVRSKNAPRWASGEVREGVSGRAVLHELDGELCRAATSVKWDSRQLVLLEAVGPGKRLCRSEVL